MIIKAAVAAFQVLFVTASRPAAFSVVVIGSERPRSGSRSLFQSIDDQNCDSHAKIDLTSVYQIGGYPGMVWQFDQDQKLVHPQDDKSNVDFLQRGGHKKSNGCTNEPPTDVCITIHGWLTASEDALERYDTQYAKVKEQFEETTSARGDNSSSSADSPINIAVIGVLWPANPFECTGQDHGVLIQQLDAMLVSNDYGFPKVALQLVRNAVVGLISLQEQLTDHPQARDALRGATSNLLDALQVLFFGENNDDDNNKTNTNDNHHIDNVVRQVAEANADFLSELESVAEDDLATGLNHTLDTVADVLDVTSYSCTMKRAELVGRKGFAPIIYDIRKQCPDLRIHLMGNSFGALVAVAAAQESLGASFAFMVLVQAAFSQNAFASRIPPPMDDMTKDIPVLNDMMEATTTGGQYRNVVDSDVVSGPIAVTYTNQDKLLRIPYALAARFKNDTGLVVPSYGHHE